MNVNVSDYKLSDYNLAFFEQDHLFIHNSFTGAFVKIDDIYSDIIDQVFKSNLDRLTELPEEIQNGMVDGGFIINKNTNEFNVLKSLHSLARFKGGNSLVLTILPTLGCNFRCPYCFEQNGNYPSKKMSLEVIKAIVKYADDHLNEGGFLNVSWYGGEPLMAFDVIEKTQNLLCDLAKRKNLTIKSSMISNGYLLDKSMSNKLVHLGIDSVQVTIDGPKEIHNRTRILSNGSGSFDRILANLSEIDASLNVSIRVNIQKSNISKFPDLLESLRNNGLNNKENIQVYSAPVRDYSSENPNIYSTCYSTGEYANEELKMNKLLKEYNFRWKRRSYGSVASDFIGPPKSRISGPLKSVIMSPLG